MEAILTGNINTPGVDDIAVYRDRGGYQALRKALAMEQDDILGEIKLSRLYGRSGAFPVYNKWSMARQQTSDTKYLVCNADEGEPGCFKDKLILGRDPHLVIESMVIAGYTIGADKGYIYIRGEYNGEAGIFNKALEQAKQKGYLGDNILGSDFSFDIQIYRGAGSYVVGEETALLRSMSGYRPFPGPRPPYPVEKGFLGKPTVVNNVETLINVPFIVAKGGKWYRGIGHPEYPGTKLFCLSGNVNRPGVYELPIGVTLRELISNYGQGVNGDLKAILPGGVASGLVNDLNIRMDYKSLADVNSLLGPGAVIVINRENSVIDIALNTLEFFARESCGKCSVCREGLRAGLMMMRRFAEGEGRQDDIRLLRILRRLMYYTANCVLGQAALNVTVSATRLFRKEFEARVRG